MAKPCLNPDCRSKPITSHTISPPIMMRQAVHAVSGEDSAAHPSVIEPVRNWYALYTASNQEKRVEEHLRTKGVEVFLPLYEITRRWKNRTTRKIELPLFTGYLFARFALTERVRVLEVPTVV